MLDLNAATLDELEDERQRLDEEIAPLAAEKRLVIDEIARRHDKIKVISQAATRSPSEIDALLRGQSANKEVSDGE